MRPFLTRFYEEVADNIGDPVRSPRLTREKMRRDLWSVDCRIFTDLLSVTGSKTILNQVEVQIPLISGQEFYPLPGNFRSFLSFQQRVDGTIRKTLGSRGPFDICEGIYLSTSDRGFQIYPKPTQDDSSWYLTYIHGPTLCHHAAALNVSRNGFGFGVPEVDAGEIRTSPNYYAGSVVHLFTESGSFSERREILHSFATQAIFRNPLLTLPSSLEPLLYEFGPLVPEPMDSIYSMDVALLNLSRSRNQETREALRQDRADMWSSILSWVKDAAFDAPSRRIRPLRMGDLTAQSENPY